MKIFLILATVLSVCTFYGCDNNPPKPLTADCVHCKDYSAEAFESVPPGLAYEMISNYKSHHWNNHLVQNNTVPTDARSVWFSLDTLKKYIYKIEQAACQSNCVKIADLGIRIYYAEYPDLSTWNTYDNDPATSIRRNEYQGLHTLLMTPTYYNVAKDLNVDFDPRYPGTVGEKGCTPLNLHNVFTRLGATIDTNGIITGGANSFILSPTIKTSVKNKGSLIPPPPPDPVINAGEGKGAVMIDLVQNRAYNY